MLGLTKNRKYIPIIYKYVTILLVRQILNYRPIYVKLSKIFASFYLFVHVSVLKIHSKIKILIIS